MTFRVGQRVICVEPGGRHWAGQNPAIVGNVYTIRKVYLRHHNGKSYAGVLLEEISNPAWEEDGEECGFYARRFRPVVERKTSIEVFQKMLTPSPEKVTDDLIFDTLADIYLATKQWTS